MGCVCRNVHIIKGILCVCVKMLPLQFRYVMQRAKTFKNGFNGLIVW